MGSYDPYTTTGRASAEGWWSFCNAREWLEGGFVWTGFDYRGEPSPNGWPHISSQYRIIDTCGSRKIPFFYYQSGWTPQPVLHLFPHWNWEGMDGKEIAVVGVFESRQCGVISEWQSLGAKDVKKDSHLARMVRFAPGAIEARGFRGGQVVMTARRPIAGSGGAMGLLASFVGNGAMVFTLRQDGNKLTGSMEGADGGFFGGSDPGRNLQRILAQFPVQVNMAERLTYMG